MNEGETGVEKRTNAVVLAHASRLYNKQMNMSIFDNTMSKT